ncbi:MAG: hypothetical protein QOG23_4989 [Blastocatellia bacterium]|nr:hypothetical protein [Blastocatellia bacterium]
MPNNCQSRREVGATLRWTVGNAGSQLVYALPTRMQALCHPNTHLSELMQIAVRLS